MSSALSDAATYNSSSAGALVPTGVPVARSTMDQPASSSTTATIASVAVVAIPAVTHASSPSGPSAKVSSSPITDVATKPWLSHWMRRTGSVSENAG